MKKSKLPSTVALIALISLTSANAGEYVDSAVVLSTEPVVETLYAPSDNCRHSAYNTPVTADPGLAIFGAALGGVAGAQFGKGSGQDAAAALGAFIGAEIAGGDGYVSGEELLGAIAGGVIGNQVGDGGGKTAATAIGAVMGSALASGKLSRDPSDFYDECGSNVVSKKVITKYKVNYEYNGLRFSGELPYKPENNVGVLVNVEVLEDRTL